MITAVEIKYIVDDLQFLKGSKIDTIFNEDISKQGHYYGLIENVRGEGYKLNFPFKNIKFYPSKTL